jgi:hypothetical protein
MDFSTTVVTSTVDNGYGYNDRLRQPVAARSGTVYNALADANPWSWAL